MRTMERLDRHGLLHREKYRRFCIEHQCHTDLCWDSRHGLSITTQDKRRGGK